MSNQNPTGFISPVTQAIYGGPTQNGQAPQASLTGTQAWLGGQPGGNAVANQGAQQSAINMAQQTAMGKGPSAATDLLTAQTAKTQGAANALASSGSGNKGAGEARRNAMMVGANATQELGANAAAARSKEQLGGEAMVGQQAGEARGQDIESGGLVQQGNIANAGLQLQQNQLNQQNAQFNAQQNQQMVGQITGGLAGAALAFGDADIDGKGANFVEPPGGEASPSAMVTLREITGPDENPMLIMINQRTGKIQKVAGTDLTPDEVACVQRPHGAGPMEAGAPGRVSREMSDGDMGMPQAKDGMSMPTEMPSFPDGNMGGQDRIGRPMTPARSTLGPKGYADGNMGAKPKTFADVVRMAHSGLYDGDPMKDMPGVRPDDNDPARGRPAGMAGRRVGNAANQMNYHDADVSGGASAKGDQARALVGGGGYATDKAGKIRGVSDSDYKMPSDSDVYNTTRNAVPESEGEWNQATHLASKVGHQSPSSKPGGPTYFENPSLQNELHQATGVKPTERYSWGGAKSSQQSNGSSGGSPFARALGGALAGYSNPSNLGALYGHGDSEQSSQLGPKQPGAVPNYAGDAVSQAMGVYHDGDLNGQLDQAHKAEMARGPTTVEVNGQDDDQSPVTKSSPVAEVQKNSSYFHAEPVIYGEQKDDPEFAARQGSDPYAKLPQGPQVSSQEISDNSLAKGMMRDNPTAYSPFLSHDEEAGGMHKHMGDTIAKPSFQEAIPRENRLKVNGVTAPGYYQSTYMDGDMGDPFLASSHPAHEGRDVTYGQSARYSFDQDIARLRQQLDAEDAAVKSDKRMRAVDVDETPTNKYYAKPKPPEKLPANPYKDGDLTSKFAGRASKKKNDRVRSARR